MQLYTFYCLAMGRGVEWSYVNELMPEKTTSHVQCKSCGHSFHGNATRIKEHLFNVPGNVRMYNMFCRDVNVHLSKYAMKLKNRGGIFKKKTALGHTRNEPIDPESFGSMGNLDEHDNPQVVGQSFQGQASRTPSDGTGSNLDASSQRLNNKTLHAAFNKQSLLELHLEWTQAFMACGIPFNVLRNPIFQDALMSTAKKGFVLPDYNKMRTEYVDKVKASTEAILKRTVLDFVPAFGCTIALDGWTSCQKKTFDKYNVHLS